MQIAVELPNDFVAFQQANEIQRDICLSYALWLFKSAKVTLGKAAELAGLDIYDFMSACKDNQIPVVVMDKQELIEELQGIARQ
jgi:predicted HTH domain antitoxin